jgi:hypothetical protein
MERRDQRLRALGYLTVRAQGGCSTQEMRAMLLAFEEGYQAVAAVELAAYRVLAASEWSERYGPPRRYLPAFWPLADVDPSRRPMSGERLIVSRVVLESPGFWEFFGKLNLLEVIRQYLNDRHERDKDREYRSAAEREQLALENALRRLEVAERLMRLEREFGADLYGSEAWRLGWEAHLRPSLDRLADFDQRGMIDGGSASSGPERLPRGDRP